MATSSSPVLPQVPATNGVEPTQTTEMAPGTVAPTQIVTGTADGLLVTDVTVTAEGTVTADKVVLWVQPSGSGDWYVARTAVLAAYTQSATDQQGFVKLVDGGDDTDVLRLGPNDNLGITHHVSQSVMALAQYTSYTAA